MRLLMSSRSRLLAPFLGAAAVIASASCEEPRTLNFEVTTGQEEGALLEDPEVALVRITVLTPDTSGVDRVVTEAAVAPGDPFTFGELPESEPLRFELTGETADGDVVARGRSIIIVPGSPFASTDEVTLPLFIQRLGAFARPPGELLRAHVHAPGAVLGEQFLFATGGSGAWGKDGKEDAASADYYDLLRMDGSTSPTFPRAARSLVSGATSAIAIDEEGATFVDYSTNSFTDLVPPDDFEFGEVSGGFTVTTPLADQGGPGLAYVVGATRTDEPSDAVLVVDANGTSVVRLAHPRKGAAALWVDGVGLAIIGGSEEGAGVEIVEDDGETVTSLPFPSDATTGAAAAVTDEQVVLVFGGRNGDAPAPTRAFDFRCTFDCVPEVPKDGKLALDAIAARGLAFAIPGAVLVTGEAESDDGIGETLVYRVSLEDDAEVTALPLRQPRRGATPIPTPNGLLAIVGGLTLGGNAARSIELLVPE